MSRLEQIEQQIAALDQTEIKALREWFACFDAELWDKQIETDAKSGKLAPLADQALRDHESGQTTEL